MKCIGNIWNQNNKDYTLFSKQFCLLQSPPKGITVPYRPLKPVTVATNLGPQQAMIQNNVAVSAGGFLPVSHAGQYTAAMTASLNPATANAAHAALIPASAQVRQNYIHFHNCFLFCYYPFSVPNKRCHNPLPSFINKYFYTIIIAYPSERTTRSFIGKH